MQKKTAICLLTVILILLIGNSLYWATQKEGYHCDEIYSYGLSNTVLSYPVCNDDGSIRWNTPADIKSYMVVPDGGGFDYINVYENQIGDVHPPFFYFIFHTISSFFPNAYSPFIGIIPNLVFTIGTCILLYLIAVRILKQRAWALLTVFIYALSVHCVNIVTYVRMYAALTFFASLTVYLHIRMMENEYKLTPLMAVALFGTIFLGAFTQYYYFVFVFPVALFCVIAMWRKRKKIWPYLLGIGITAAVYVAVWPVVFSHIFITNRGAEAFQNVAESSIFYNFGRFFISLYVGLGIVFSLLFYGALILYILYRKKEKALAGDALYLILATGLFYFIVIGKIAPYQADRYIAPIVPLLCLLFVFLLSVGIRFIRRTHPGVGNVMAWIVVIALCIGQGQNIHGRLISREADEKGDNYLYRLSEEDRAFSRRIEGKPCVMVHTHEAQFLLNFPDYMQFSKTAFVDAEEIEKLRHEHVPEEEKEVILYIQADMDGEKIAAKLTEILQFDGCEILRQDYAHNDANIYRIYRD